MDFDSFFGSATADQDWYGAEERETAERFKSLVTALKQNLSDIKVFKAGEVEMDAYVACRTPQGDFAEITTGVVETRIHILSATRFLEVRGSRDTD